LLYDEKAVIVLVQYGHELKEGEGPANIKMIPQDPQTEHGLAFAYMEMETERRPRSISRRCWICRRRRAENPNQELAPEEHHVGAKVDLAAAGCRLLSAGYHVMALWQTH
jgi:hypothetical protein